MKTCPNCLKLHDRPLTFCSRSCANKRNHSAKIYKKISNSLRKYNYVNVECLICKNEFRTLSNGNKKTCSKICATELTASKVRGTKHSVKNSSNMGGFRENGGRCKLVKYTNILNELMYLNADEIKIAEILDNLQLNWKRNKIGLKYADENGKIRKFYPDFYIEENDLFVEYKGWVTSHMIHKMKNAVKRNNINLKIIYSNDKRYRTMGLNFNEFKDNPNLLFE